MWTCRGQGQSVRSTVVYVLGPSLRVSTFSRFSAVGTIYFAKRTNMELILKSNLAGAKSQSALAVIWHPKEEGGHPGPGCQYQTAPCWPQRDLPFRPIGVRIPSPRPWRKELPAIPKRCLQTTPSPPCWVPEAVLCTLAIPSFRPLLRRGRPRSLS